MIRFSRLFVRFDGRGGSRGCRAFTIIVLSSAAANPAELINTFV